jgi:aspartate carbamoyltransferase catalytic subunit
MADLGREGILSILDRAESFRTVPPGGAPYLGRILGLFFFQPSVRTRFGFHAAMARLGGTAIELTETKFQAGMSRPESLPDVIRSISDYCDALVLRHESVTAFREALEASDVPVVNGGCGHEHHPTQALIDLFAIRRRFGRLEGLRVGLAGDLAASRSARSLLQGLAHFPLKELRLISPQGKEAPASLLADLPADVIHWRDQLDIGGLDVLYMAGLPKGTGPGRSEDEVRERFRLTRQRAESLPESSLVLNPLPRIDEIDPEVDSLSIAGYFSQSKEAVFVRCAVLEAVLQS